MSPLRSLYILALSLFALSGETLRSEEAESGFYVNYSATPSLEDVAKFDLCILDPGAKIDLKQVRRPGQIFLAYVSTVEARPDSDLERLARELKVPTVAMNEAWGSHVLDVTHAGWQKAVIQTADAAAAKGFDGLFLDTIDSVQRLAKANPGKAAMAKEAVEHLVEQLRARFPNAKLIMNRGFDLLPKVQKHIDGVLVESVYQTSDSSGREFKAVSVKDSAWLEDKIREVKAMGLEVYAIDYVSPSESGLAKETARRLRALGCVPFITTPAINGTHSGAGKDVSRRILVLYGWDPKFADRPVTWPIDTLTAGHFQTFLEWMGYELDYLNVGKKSVPSPLPPEYAGVILDQTLALRPDQEEMLADWLGVTKQSGVPILFGGGFPFTLDEVAARVGRMFGCQGSLGQVNGVSNIIIDHLDSSMMNAEVMVKPRSITFTEVIAPLDARVFLSMKGRTALGDEVISQPVFQASWGAAWLEPYIVQRASQEHRRFYADPLRFLQRWLAKSAAFPVPDATTMNGRRMFYSHIDGDGFSSLSHFAGHPTCAEVVRDRVLKAYSLPVTVSVIEAEMQGWLKAAKPGDGPKLQEIARSIFALPHVQAASHTFSHPYQMDVNDPNPGHYTLKHAPLSDVADYPEIDVTREIKGSIDFINASLLPPDKRVELLLWPGNTRPGTEALRLCRELGVQNMNGGDTIISRVYPGLAGIAPRTCPWDDELQVFAANQNEFMYADGFTGPYFGGFATVVDTFKLTETPRRMKPVNVYYHFYSGTYVSSLRALLQIFDWCKSQPLHPVTASEFARIVRDVRDARVTLIAPSHWRITSGGDVRTFRIDETMGVPDMPRCKGVLGWKVEQGSCYIHTDGRRDVDLVLTSTKAHHLRLAESSARMEFQELSSRRARFTTSGWGDNVEMIFAGLPAGGSVRVSQKGESKLWQADSDGAFALTVPARCVEPITLEVAAYASGK